MGQHFWFSFTRNWLRVVDLQPNLILIQGSLRSLFSSVCYRSLTVITGQTQCIYIYILLRPTHFYIYITQININLHVQSCSVHSWILLWPGFCESFQSAKTPHACVQPQGSELQQDAQPDLRSSTPKEYVLNLSNPGSIIFLWKRWLGQFSESISTDPRVPGINPLSASQVSSPHLPSSCLWISWSSFLPVLEGFFGAGKNRSNIAKVDESKSSPNLQVAPKKCFRFW